MSMSPSAKACSSGTMLMDIDNSPVRPTWPGGMSSPSRSEPSSAMRTPTRFRTFFFSVSRASSGGVNQFVIHGQAYTGNYPATTWPGYTAFGYGVSDIYSDKQPHWDHGLAQVLDTIGKDNLGAAARSRKNRRCLVQPAVRYRPCDAHAVCIQ